MYGGGLSGFYCEIDLSSGLFLFTCKEFSCQKRNPKHAWLGISPMTISIYKDMKDIFYDIVLPSF